MWKGLSIPLVCLIGCSIGAEYRATFSSAGTEADSTKLYITSDFGTPQQNGIKSRLYINDGGPNPQLLNKRTCTNGFDPNVSTTFNWTSSFPGGIYGTDTIIFGDPIVQPNTKLRIINDDCTIESFISLRLSRGFDDFTFIGDFMATQPNPVVVLYYNNIGLNGSLPTTGTLVAGTTAPDLCNDDWSYIESQQLDNYDSWALEVNQLSITKDFLTKPKKAKLSIDDYNLYLPEPYYTKIMKQLKFSTDGFIACNVSDSSFISFHVNGSYITIGPSEYLDHSTVAKFGLCKSRIKCQDPEHDYFTLPFTFFRNYCLLLDYKNKQIGVTSTVVTKAGSIALFVR